MPLTCASYSLQHLEHGIVGEGRGVGSVARVYMGDVESGDKEWSEGYLSIYTMSSESRD